MAAGAEFGLKPFGIRAMDAMRLEKSYRLVGTELSIEYAALESGLHRFVHLNKGDFRGQRKLAEWQERGFANAMVTLAVQEVQLLHRRLALVVAEGSKTAPARRARWWATSCK